ncbi:S41 family peptidase [Oceanivirga salmonicida]|uniref:S41 family peptidase n=1 Tax=Oceanivirga salmonicida TaxID=1769291 RepID=UPI0012E31CEE|nr:S41 family peptidase [Oceanivirga salmonicida]
MGIKKFLIFVFSVAFFLFISFKFKTKDIEFIPNKFNIVKEKEYIFDRKARSNAKYENIIKRNWEFGNTVGNVEISIEKAIEDIEVFMYLLKTRYPYYDKFGGDATFSKAKNEILKILNRKDKIDSFELSKIILNNLKVIEDIHFTVFGNNSISKNFYYYKYDKYVDNKLLDKISKEDREKYIKYTLDKNGNIRYTIVANSNINDKNIKLNLKLKDGKFLEYTLQKINSINFKINKNEFEEHKNYYIIRVRNFKNDDRNYYKKYSDKIKEKDLVIDFRGNTGGYISTFNNILSKYYYNMEEAINRGLKKSALNYIDLTWDKIENKTILNRVYKKNKNKIYILVDRGTYSAPEIISIILKLVDYKNVIILGVSTAGAISGNTSEFTWTLPNSKISVNTGYIYHETIDKAKEYIGLEPDIWLDPNDEKIFEKLDRFIKKRK